MRFDEPLEAPGRFLATLSQRAAWVFLLGFLALGAMVATTIPAFQIPDEDRHWWAALRRVSAITGHGRDQVCGTFVQLPMYLQHDRMRWKGGEHMRIGLAPGLSGIPAACTDYQIPYGLTLTYPSVVIGYPIFFERAVRDGGAAARYLYFARLMSGLLVIMMFWRVMTAFAARAPTPGLLSLSVMLWSPLFVQQGFSVSADPIMLMFVLALIAVCLRTPRIPWIDFALYLGLGVIATWTKPTIVPLALVPVVWILAQHLGGSPWRWRSWRGLFSGLRVDRTGVALALLSVLLVGSGFLCFASMGGPSGVSAVDGTLNPPAQLNYVKENLGTSMKGFEASVRTYLTFRDLTGVLGWLDTPMPTEIIDRWERLVYVVVIFDAIFAFLVLAQGRVRALARRLFAWTASASLILVGVVTSMLVTAFAMYVTWTAYTSGSVAGVQARYFFPSLMVATLAFAAVRPTPLAAVPDLPSPDVWTRRIVQAALAVSLITLGLNFLSLFTRLHLTLWARYW